MYGSEGTPAPGTGPGARYLATAWSDASGRFWLMGGYGPDANERFGYLNDLWLYAPTTGLWAWQAGSNLVTAPGAYGTPGVAAAGNSPGAREMALSWRESSGKLWLFGGQGYDRAGLFGALNDLWAYDPAAEQWSWVGGAAAANAAGAYGAIGVAAPANIPGARYGGVSWTDPAGRLWLFGGFGQDAAGNTGALNDLWKYQ